MYNNLISFIAFKIYKYKMYCRVKNQRETEYGLREYIRKHTYIYYCTLKNTNIDCNIFDKISKLIWDIDYILTVWLIWKLDKWLFCKAHALPDAVCYLLRAYIVNKSSSSKKKKKKILELLQYLLTLRYYKNSVPCAKGYRENENKRIAYLQSGDWYHLNTRWITQKKKFIMSYVSLQYIIFILFYLLLSILSVSEFVSLYYIFVTIKGNKSYKPL